MALGNEVVAKNDPEAEKSLDEMISNLLGQSDVTEEVEEVEVDNDENPDTGESAKVEEEEEEEEEDLIPEAEPEEEEEEADLIDPVTEIRENCEAKTACQSYLQKLEECNSRVSSKSKTDETCHDEMMDWVHAVDHCISKELFTKLK